ncbi:ATP-binding protein [Streptomyces sp. NPDC046197]|uniref:ATP-binding protein n=1 Tax=Streptomyces sp. NPDC046197 TaxID=3154337 RepID=UPI0034032716
MRAESVGRRLPANGGPTADPSRCFACRRDRWGGSWLATFGECPGLLLVDSHGLSIGSARRAAAQYASVCCPPIDPADVELLVSELCTNAHRHATGWWRLRVHAHRDRLVLDVDDSCAATPRRKEPDTVHGSGGLGMLLVDQLASDYLVLRHPAGKTVRVVLAF